MTPQWPPKDPDELLDYRIDWQKRLDGDTIASAQWIVPSGIVLESQQHEDGHATVWLSGGTAGQDYIITNRVQTSAGRIMDQSVRLPIRER